VSVPANTAMLFMNNKNKKMIFFIIYANGIMQCNFSDKCAQKIKHLAYVSLKFNCMRTFNLCL